MNREYITSPFNGGEEKVKAFCEGKTILEWDDATIKFTDGSILEIERSDFYGDEYTLITP
jgi:hypothetical protein